MAYTRNRLGVTPIGVSYNLIIKKKQVMIRPVVEAAMDKRWYQEEAIRFPVYWCDFTTIVQPLTNFQLIDSVARSLYSYEWFHSPQHVMANKLTRTNDTNNSY